MANIIIPASKSITITDRFPKRNINQNYIKVGYQEKYHYVSYLFFDISNIPCNAIVSRAELVLFKMNNFYKDANKKFIIYQLNDYFSSFTTYNNPPTINKNIKKDFYPIISKVAVRMDVTNFILFWIKSKFSCSGILLDSKTNCSATKFGSSICEDSYLIPFIKVTFNHYKCNDDCNENCHHKKPTVRKVKVTGTVAPKSKYQAIVNVEVKRKGREHKDKYYVADEYDNSSSNTPLSIDKTYNIAIIPREKQGDSEKINFYGSYKE